MLKNEKNQLRKLVMITILTTTQLNMCYTDNMMRNKFETFKKKSIKRNLRGYLITYRIQHLTKKQLSLMKRTNGKRQWIKR